MYTDRYIEQSGGRPSPPLVWSHSQVLAFFHGEQKPNAGFDVGRCRNKIIDKNRGNKNIKSITKNWACKTPFECLNLRSDTLQPGDDSREPRCNEDSQIKVQVNSKNSLKQLNNSNYFDDQPKIKVKQKHISSVKVL